MPFTIYPSVVDSKIVSVRLTSNTGDGAKENNFAHITMEMIVRDGERQEVQYNTFERRMDVSTPQHWKLCRVQEDIEFDN